MLKGADTMSSVLKEHPLIIYMSLILPALLLGATILLEASLFLIMVILVWIGISFIILVLPVTTDSGSSQ
ncbi:MAG: hypothetical protein A3K75_03310 [Euryarchaeota archaeon RBG_13_61_15]|nr:MAG: hypothetical protein A3K75_03310 [Euryarchaeota archaeon RBG_13_61_15]